jgi:hypothetical protein
LQLNFEIQSSFKHFTLKEEIRIHRNDYRQLERLYRANKSQFKREFSSVYPDLEGSPLAEFWRERLYHESDDIHWGTRGELFAVLLAALLAGSLAKLPSVFGIDESFFYPRNIGFIVFPLLMAYFAWHNRLSPGKTAFVAGTTLLGLVFINMLPDVRQSDTLVLSCIHLLLVLWCVFGFAFTGGADTGIEKRLLFLKYNGDLVVMTTLILLAGGIMTGVTIGLFSLIGFSIERFFFENIVVFGLPIAPIVGAYLTQSNPQLVEKISPVIAKIFSPLVLVMLVIYLGTMIYSGKDPYNDREFLVIFNALLVGVMAIIFFSVSGTSNPTKNGSGVWVVFLLSVVTVIINSIALSAILFRISEWGITPNRAAVLGGNILILANLVLVMAKLYKTLSQKTEINEAGNAIAFFLPVYFFWAAVVTFLFPFLFAFK